MVGRFRPSTISPKGAEVGVFLFRILLCVGLVGCETVAQKLSVDKVYRHDMVIEVNGQRGEGVLVVPKASAYTFKIESKGDIDAFTLQSCHKEIFPKGVKKDGLFGRKRRLEFDHVPTAEDQVSACPVQLGAYQKTEGKHSFAFIDFESDKEQLPAVLHCNGEVKTTNGVSICQSRAGLMQRIVFPVEVGLAAKKCEMPEPLSTGVYRFSIREGFCIFAFMETKKPWRVHRLTTIGYQDFVVREAVE